MALLRVDVERMAGSSAILVRCHGDIDAHTFMDFEDAINGILDEEVTHIAVDLKDVNYVSSAGMGVLIAAQSEAQDGGGGVALIGPSPAVREVLESIGLNDLCLIAETEQEALEWLGVAGPG